MEPSWGEVRVSSIPHGHTTGSSGHRPHPWPAAPTPANDPGSPWNVASSGAPLMTSMFGPNGQRVLALVTSIPGLSISQVDQVTGAWKRGSPPARAEAWAELNSAKAEDERYWILAAAALARREALETARRMHRTDWAFWAAACDAGAAVAAGSRIGRHYDTLVAPFAEVMQLLAHCPV